WDHVAPPPFRACLARLLWVPIALAALASPLIAAPVGAQGAPDPVAAADAGVAALSAQADALADRYFESLGRVAEIQQRADDIEAKLPALRPETARPRAGTRA